MAFLMLYEYLLFYDKLILDSHLATREIRWYHTERERERVEINQWNEKRVYINICVYCELTQERLFIFLPYIFHYGTLHLSPLILSLIVLTISC